MSGLLGGGQVSKAAPEASSLRVVTSSYGRPIPLVWGKVRIAPFTLWYDDFKAIAHEQDVGGKGGSSGASVNYTYQAAVILGICEGTVNAVPRVWKGKGDNVSASTSSQTYTKEETVFIPVAGGSVTLTPPGTLLGITNIYAAWGTGDTAQFYNLGNPADYTRSGNVLTFSGSSAVVGYVVTVVYTYTKATAPVSPIADMGLTLFKGTYDQAVWSHLTANHPTQNVKYPGIAYLASATFDLGSSSDLPNIGVEVETAHAYSSTIADVNPRDFVADFLTNPYYGAYFPADRLGSLTSYSDYCVASGIFLSPEYNEQQPAFEILERVAAITNSEWVQVDGRFTLRPYADQAVTGNGVTWTPNLVAVYEIGPDDFVQRSESGPIVIKRKSPDTRYNQVKVKFKDRDRQYNDNVVEGRDSAEIGKNGLRPSPQDIDSPEIKTTAVAEVVANLAVQRAVNVCNTYEFTLKQNKGLLVPLDLLSLTHPDYPGMSQRLVLITQIDEDVSTGDLSIIAEEVPVGTASAITYPLQTPSGYAVNYNEVAGNVAAPTIFELPPVLATETGLELAVAVRGAAANWGGCEVWSSIDGTTYKKMGTVYGASRYGALTTTFTTTVGIQLATTDQVLSGSALDASTKQTLCYAAGTVPEYFAYQTATLTAPGAYTLSGLVRALYETAQDNHAIGNAFVRVDERVFRSGPLDLSLLDKMLYFKFLSFNRYGGGVQALADVSAYTYTITGAMVRLRPADVSGLAASGGVGSGRVTWTPNTEGDYGETELRLGASWAAGTLLARIKGSSYPWTIATAGTYTVWAKHRDVLGNESLTAAGVAVVVDAFGLSVASHQRLGFNLLSETDQAVGVRFAVDWNPNGAILAGDNGTPVSSAPLFTEGTAGWAGTGWILSAGRTKSVYIRENGRVTSGPDTATDGLGNLRCADFGMMSEVPVISGQRYYASVYACAFYCRTGLWLLFYDSAGALLSYDQTGPIEATTNYPSRLGAMTRLAVAGIAPTNAAYARLMLTKWTTKSGYTSSHLFWAAPQVEPASANQDAPGPYNPGPVAAIGTDQLSAAAATSVVTKSRLTDLTLTSMVTPVFELEHPFTAPGLYEVTFSAELQASSVSVVDSVSLFLGFSGQAQAFGPQEYSVPIPSSPASQKHHVSFSITTILSGLGPWVYQPNWNRGINSNAYVVRSQMLRLTLIKR